MVNYCYTLDDYSHFNTAFLKMRRYMKNKNYIHNTMNICMPYAITQRGEEFFKKLPYLEIGGINSQKGEGENKWTLSIRKITHLTEQEQDEIQEYFDKIILETRENKNMLDIDPKLLFVINFNKNITGDLVIGDYDKDEFVIVDKGEVISRIKPTFRITNK